MCVITHICPEMNTSIISEYFMSYWAFRHFHILYFIFDIILCFGGISLMRTLSDAYYEEGESHLCAFLDISLNTNKFCIFIFWN